MPANAKYRLCLVAIIAGIIQIRATAAPAFHEVQLFDCSGIPCVDMTIGSAGGEIKTLRLLIDTSGPNAYLDSRIAASMNLDVKPMAGADGKPIEEIQQTVAPGAKLGDLPMGDFPFLVLNLNDSDNSGSLTKRKAAPLPGDGALTFGSFRNRIVQLDFRNHVMRVSEPITTPQPVPANSADLIVKHFGNYGPATIVTPGFSVNGRLIEAQIDTLFTGTILIYPESVNKLVLEKQSKARKKEDFPFWGGVKLVRGNAEAEGFGNLELLQNAPLYFATPDAATHTPEGQFDATVGVALLSGTAMTLDFVDKKIWVER
ncbi:MAG TPA: hypothetical protein VG168_17715 [Bryobacteraceae bacterium]|nr:hypothetical protein [Bryobacteraceae bacterium]